MVTHPPEKNPLLLPLREQNFFDKKKAKLSLDNEAVGTQVAWSADFPLDIAGSSGRVVCKNSEGREYDLMVEVQLCQSGLTKVRV